MDETKRKGKLAALDELLTMLGDDMATEHLPDAPSVETCPTCGKPTTECECEAPVASDEEAGELGGKLDDILK